MFIVEIIVNSKFFYFMLNMNVALNTITGYSGYIPKSRNSIGGTFQKITGDAIREFSCEYDKNMSRLCQPVFPECHAARAPAYPLHCYRNPCRPDRKPSAPYYTKLGPYNVDVIGN